MHSDPVLTTRTQTWLAITIILCTFLAYFPALSGGFVWDDDYHLTNSVITKDSAIYRIWCTTEMANYWPVAWTSYWLEYQIWGLAPLGYHFVNIAIHIASSLLIWKILKQLDVPAPAIAALIFSVHPINVESVAWISQRRNVLSLFFYLVAISSYLQFDARPTHGCRRYGLAILLFVLAMLSKGSAVILPVVLLMCMLWKRSTLCREDLLRCLPFVIIALVFAVVEIYFQYVHAIGNYTIRDDGFFGRLSVAGRAVWFYLYKAAWPVELCFVYPRWTIDESNLLTYLPCLFLFGPLGVFWMYRQSWGRGALFGLISFVVALGPFLGFFTIFFMRYSFVADHYAYFSMVPFIAVVVAVGDACRRRWPRGKVFFNALAAVAVISLGVLTWQRCCVFRDAETLWRDTLQKNPKSWLAHNDLGNLLWVRGDLGEASEHFLRAIDANPQFPETYFNYGGVLDEQGETEKAVEQLRQANRLSPGMQSVQAKLAEVLLKLDGVDDAVSHYRQILHEEPGAVWAHLGLGHILLQQQKLGEALEQCRVAVAMDPNSGQANFLMGCVLHSCKELTLALNYLQLAVLQEPNNAEARHRLGVVLADLGQLSQAESQFRHAVRIDPTDFRSENNLGLLMESRGNIQGALIHFRRGIRANPNDPLLHFNLGRLLADSDKPLDAINCFRESLRLEPDFVMAEQFMRRIQGDGRED